MLEYLKLNLLSTDDYIEVTRHNASTSDFTAGCFLGNETKGQQQTKEFAGVKYVDLSLSDQALDSARMLYRVVANTGKNVINLAGSGLSPLSKRNITQRQVNIWVHDLLVLLHAYYPIQLKSGGQTGVDIAAAVVGPLLRIPTEINFPDGFKQSDANGNSYTQTREDILESVIAMQRQLKEDLTVESLKIP